MSELVAELASEIVPARSSLVRRHDRILSVNDSDLLPLGPTDWYYRNLVPKDEIANLKFRHKCLRWAYDKPEIADELRVICSRDMLFYINVFGWTIDTKKFPRQPVRPFITYPYQDLALLELQSAIGNRDIAIPKSRDMGASWICILALEHFWHFSPYQLFLLASRKKELVDGDHRSLMAKLDWFWEHLPFFLKPNVDAKAMERANRDNGSRFDGEATVENLGTGDRRTAIVLDEYGKMKQAEAIATSTRDVTDCRIFNSTPFGSHGTGRGFYDRVKNPATLKVFMHWSEHPLKNQGMYQLVAGKKVLVNPATFDWKKHYDFRALTPLASMPRSEWYDRESRREGNPITQAQELDIDFVGSSERFMDHVLLATWRERCLLPTAEGAFVVDDETAVGEWSPAKDGDFKLWCPFDGVRPPFSEYVVGADPCAGTGGRMAAESALVVMDKRTHRQVARFCTRRMRPESFGRYCVAVCRWFWDALFVPEVNGEVGRGVLEGAREAGHHNFFQREVDLLGWLGKKSKKLGYFNSDRGTAILSALQDGMRLGRVEILDEYILEQLACYEWHTDSKVIHGATISVKFGESASKNHGDAAIAAGCAYLGVRDSPALESAAKTDETDPVPDYDCPARRYRDREVATSSFQDNEGGMWGETVLWR